MLMLSVLLSQMLSKPIQNLVSAMRSFERDADNFSYEPVTGVREVQNLCGNNQMRDVFFEEIETDDPVSWVRGFLKGKDVELTVDEKENGDLTVYAVSGGVSQKFLMTKL